VTKLPVAGDDDPHGLPLGFDTTVAHASRVYDYWLGGKDNFAADRAVAEEIIAVRPTILRDIRANRAFLGRAVRFLAAEAGIRQFLDVGTGLPTSPNVHEVAQSAAPECRVVYVDNDPIVLAHARALLTSSQTSMSRCRRPGAPTRRRCGSSTAWRLFRRAWCSATGGGRTPGPPASGRTCRPGAAPAARCNRPCYRDGEAVGADGDLSGLG
jgi:hypothetical protein